MDTYEEMADLIVGRLMTRGLIEPHEHKTTKIAGAISRALREQTRDVYAHSIDLARGLFLQGYGLNAETWDPKSDYGRGRLDVAELIGEHMPAMTPPASGKGRDGEGCG